MRVAHVITRLIVGGAQENTLDSVAGLRRRPGFEVHLASGPTRGSEGSLLPRCASIGLTVEEVPALVRPIHPAQDLRARAQLIALFERIRPHVVHTHSGKAGILGRSAARRAGVPVVVHTIHGPSFGSFQGALPNLLFRSAERWAGRRTTHFVAVCDAMIDQYVAAGIGPRSRYTRIWSGFDLAAFLTAGANAAVRAQLGFAPEDVVVGIISRLAPLKGHDDLLELWPEVMRRCPRARLLAVGDGPWRARIEARVAQAGIGAHVRFTGLVSPESVPSLVGAMDVLVHLSRREGLARALPQALAAGRPVVAYDCDGAREVCLDGVTGFLVPPGDMAAAGRRLAELCVNPAQRAALGEAGRALVRERFGVERMVDDLASLYQRLWREREEPAG